MKTRYAVCGMETTHKLNTGNALSLSWAPGMIGVIPVFANKKSAQKYAGNLSVVAMNTVKKEAMK